MAGSAPAVRAILACGLLATTACSSGSGVRPSGPAAWPEFRLNAANNPTIPGNLRTAWRVDTHAGISSSPSIIGSTVYVGNNGGALYAIDLRTGRVRWTYRTAAPLMTNPLIWHGLVIAGEGNAMGHSGDAQHPTMVGDSANSLFAIDAKTGRLRWHIPLAGSGMPTPAILGGILVHHNGAGLLSGIDPSTGNVRYTMDIVTVASMSAIMPLGPRRFVTNGGALGFENVVTERNASDGSAVWSTTFPADHWGFGDCPVAGDATNILCNYVVPPPRSTEFRPGIIGTEHAYAVDGRGKLRWDVALESGPMPARNLAAIPLALGHMLFFGSPVRPVFHALDTETGRVIWLARVRGIVRDGAVFKRGLLYFGDSSGYLWALDARTGAIIGVKKTRQRFSVGSPVIAGRTLVIGSNGGSVIAIPLDVVRSSHDR